MWCSLSLYGRYSLYRVCFHPVPKESEHLQFEFFGRRFITPTLCFEAIFLLVCSDESWFHHLLQRVERILHHLHRTKLGRLYTYRISHFTDISRLFSQNTSQNMKHPLYTFHISFKFCVREKINYEILLTFRENAAAGVKWCKMRKVKKVLQNTSLCTFRFSHFARISCNFTKSVQPALGIRSQPPSTGACAQLTTDMVPITCWPSILRACLWRYNELCCTILVAINHFNCNIMSHLSSTSRSQTLTIESLVKDKCGRPPHPK